MPRPADGSQHWRIVVGGIELLKLVAQQLGRGWIDAQPVQLLRDCPSHIFAWLFVQQANQG